MDGSLWVTDSAKVQYTNAFVCGLLGGTMISSGACLLGQSRLLKYPLTGTDWAVGQYQGDGSWATAAATANAGVGANYATRSAASVTNGSTLANGRFGGARGIALTEAGNAWITDSDYGLSIASSGKAIRIVNSNFTEGNSFGTSTWPSGNTWANRNDPQAFDYPVGAARMLNGHIVVTSQTAELLKEYLPDGTFVRNIYLRQAAGTAGAGDGGYRSPYAIAVDPNTGDLLVGYIDPGSGQRSFIERIDPDGCTTSSVGNPAGSFQDRCTVKNRIGLGTLATGDGQTWATFTIAVEPSTGDIYVGQRSGLISVFAADGTSKGSFSAFGGGTKNGQLSTVRGMVFDERGFLYLTVSEGNTSARVEIFARTPDPVSGLTATFTDAGKTAATLSWDALAAGVTADAQAPVRDYVIEQTSDEGTTWTVVPSALSTATTFTVTGLDPDATYQFRVSAWNEAGNGDLAVASPVLPVPGTLTLVKSGNGAVAESAEEAVHVSAGSDVTFTYVVKNEGPSEVTGITLEDSVLGTVVAPEDFTGTLAADESVTFEATGLVAAGAYHNTATVRGTSIASPVTATDSWYGFGVAPHMTVVKAGDGVEVSSAAEAHHVQAGTG